MTPKKPIAVRPLPSGPGQADAGRPAAAFPHGALRPVGLAARYLGAASLIAVGVVHGQQYYDAGYSVIPTIGGLFLLTFVSATTVGLTLMAPLGRLARRAGRLTLALAAIGGIGIAAGALGGLFISESVGLFGFMEFGYRQVIVISIALEVSAVVFLSVFVLAALRAGAVRGRLRTPSS